MRFACHPARFAAASPCPRGRDLHFARIERETIGPKCRRRPRVAKARGLREQCLAVSHVQRGKGRIGGDKWLQLQTAAGQKCGTVQNDMIACPVGQRKPPGQPGIGKIARPRQPRRRTAEALKLRRTQKQPLIFQNDRSFRRNVLCGPGRRDADAMPRSMPRLLHLRCDPYRATLGIPQGVAHRKIRDRDQPAFRRQPVPCHESLRQWHRVAPPQNCGRTHRRYQFTTYSRHRAQLLPRSSGAHTMRRKCFREPAINRTNTVNLGRVLGSQPPICAPLRPVSCARHRQSRAGRERASALCRARPFAGDSRWARTD